MIMLHNIEREQNHAWVKMEFGKLYKEIVIIIKYHCILVPPSNYMLACVLALKGCAFFFIW